MARRIFDGSLNDIVHDVERELQTFSSVQAQELIQNASERVDVLSQIGFLDKAVRP